MAQQNKTQWDSLVDGPDSSSDTRLSMMGIHIWRTNKQRMVWRAELRKLVLAGGWKCIGDADEEKLSKAVRYDTLEEAVEYLRNPASAKKLARRRRPGAVPPTGTPLGAVWGILPPLG